MTVTKDQWDEATQITQKIYADHGNNGGPFHILLDDGNVSDHDLAFCVLKAAEILVDPTPVYSHHETVDDRRQLATLCVRLGGILLDMSEEQRLEFYREVWRD